MSVILESANRINALKSAVEAVTGQSYDNLTQGIQALKDGYSTSEVEGVQYTDIIYNDDDTVTLIDTNGNEHIIACTYENNRLMSMTYDGKEVMTIYDYGDLVAVGETEVDVANAPLDNTIEALIDKSGVLDSTEGTVEDKVGALIDKASWEKAVLYRFNSSTSIDSCFQGIGASKLPLLDFSEKTSCNHVCRGMPLLERIDYYIDAPLCTSYNNAFQDTPKFTYMKGVNTAGAKSVGGMYNNSAIEEIEVEFDFSNVSSANNMTAFVGATKLKVVRFVSECIYWSIKFGSRYLIAESIQSIFGGLNSEVTGQTLTLTLTAVKKAFETSEDANDGDTSETWKALVASKPNWTIILS